MAHKVGDRVLETTIVEGTGNMTLLGALTSYKSVDSFCTVNGDTMDVVIAGGSQWEFTRITRVSAGVYSRATPYSSSTGSAIVFVAGEKEVWGDIGAFFAEHLNTVEIAVASAATTDIGVLQGIMIAMSLGTGPVTSFGTAANKLRIVRYTGAVVLQCNTTSLILMGVANGATRTVTAGSVGIYKSDASGNVRELSFTYGDGSPVAIPATSVTPTTLAGSALSAGFIMINGTLVASVAGNALTIALKTLAGTDPSATDPVLVIFRNATLATGNYVLRTITAATSVVVSSGSTLGTANNVPFKLRVTAHDDGGTFRLGIINALTPYLLDESQLRSSTAEGGAGAADSAGVFYTGTAVTSKAFRSLGVLDYPSGLAAAGTWSAAPTTAQLTGQGVPGRREPTFQIFTASGTWTKPAGCNSVVVEVIGGGGAGGGNPSTASSNIAAAAGGGGGGYAMKRITTPGATETVTVATAAAGAAASAGAAGGTASFGSHVSATGGAGGNAGSAVTTAAQVAGGAGGAGASGDVNMTGSYGGMSNAVGDPTRPFYFPGVGGAAAGRGGGSAHSSSAASSAGVAGANYGGGGSGAQSYNTATTYAGGNGAVGCVIVWEYE